MFKVFDQSYKILSASDFFWDKVFCLIRLLGPRSTWELVDHLLYWTFFLMYFILFPINILVAEPEILQNVLIRKVLKSNPRTNFYLITYKDQLVNTMDWWKGINYTMSGPVNNNCSPMLESDFKSTNNSRLTGSAWSRHEDSMTHSAVIPGPSQCGSAGSWYWRSVSASKWNNFCFKD